MSSRKWDCYEHYKIQRVATDLQMEDSPLRRVLGDELQLFAKAVREIEWVESGDKPAGSEDEFIRYAIGEDADALVLEKVAGDLRATIQLAQDLLEEVTNE